MSAVLTGPPCPILIFEVFLVDTFIDGPFEESLKDPSLLYRGSSNQTIHKVVHI